MKTGFAEFKAYNSPFSSIDDFRHKVDQWLLIGCVSSASICHHRRNVVFIQKSGASSPRYQQYPFFYPENAKCRFFAQYVAPDYFAWQRMLTFGELEIVGFDVTKSRGTSLDEPFVFSNGDVKYLSLKKENDKITSDFQVECWRYSDNAWPDYLRLRDTKSEPNDEYQKRVWKYYQSPEWRVLRDARRKMDDWQCVRCGTAEKLQCHHLTRERMFNERLTDLVTMCDHCHHTRHEHDLRRKGQWNGH